MGQVYTKQFREQAMKLVTEQGYTPHRAAMQLGIPGSTLESWLKKVGYRRQPIQPGAHNHGWTFGGGRASFAESAVLQQSGGYQRNR